ncbi:FAD-dependent monooxygenase [Ktedonospora formicarum]|uniref:Oxidoreductase n=1 Tax=Ktedonospora formicarum TaxID=2778364 RepID=A0A8J3I0L8_9CHLR|nr:FAD-dependent monooxygenase [Ktedonospora formicarum]GHO47777.1 oxidoreductase [Ktedonospora formicarum]
MSQQLPIQNILISGASIAGLTLAYWLKQYHFNVTVVEQGAGPRMGGSPIDVRGQALDVAARMGILPQVQAAQVGTDGMTFVNASGKPIGKVNPNQFDEQPGEDVELRRDVLVDILYGLTKESVDFLFQDTITALKQDETGVDVTFAHHEARQFDVVIGADGLHSAVRRLVFGEEAQFVRYLGMYVSIVEVGPETNAQANRVTFYNTPGRMAGLSRYPDQDYAMFVFRSPKLHYDYHSIQEKKHLLLNAFAGESAWEVPQLLDAVRDAPDLYIDEVSQVRMPHWSQGRVALIGDAAHCAAFLSGMGSTLAMVGASTLAEELARAHADYRQAFTQYEKIMRPIVEPTQARVPEVARFFVPTTSFGIWARNQLTHFMPLLEAFSSRNK